MTRTKKISGIIISRRNWGEADKLLSIYTQDQGKVIVLAKGIRKASSKRAPLLELFTYVNLLVHQGKKFAYVTEVTSAQAFVNIRTRLERLFFAYICLELVERLSVEDQPADKIFRELLKLMTALNDLQTTRAKAYENLTEFKRFILEDLGFIKKNNGFSSQRLDREIEQVLESKLKSPKILTRIQQVL